MRQLLEQVSFWSDQEVLRGVGNEMETIRLTIDGQAVEAAADQTVLQAARAAGCGIPTLCYCPSLKPTGSCRVCLVEVQGMRSLATACTLPVSDGMTVFTNTPKVRQARRGVVELLLSDHPAECLTCNRSGSCELQSVAHNLGIRDLPYGGSMGERSLDSSNPSILRDMRKCISCRRCVEVCSQVQGVSALGASRRGFETQIGPAFGDKLGQVACALCGQCVLVCPTGALTEQDSTGKVWQALADPDKVVVVQIAPAIRTTIGEEFGLPPGTPLVGELVEGLRRLGFHKVFDTDFAADLTIMEEGTELLHRLQSGGKLPLITSCSPGWVKYCEHFYPELLPNLSSCKSPQEMFGAVMKNWYAGKHDLDPQKVFVVSVMPCTAKKFEITRPELATTGAPDVDAVLTTRELAGMFKEAGLVLPNLPKAEFDQPLGESTGAAVIFGATGGVMEAALRTVYELVTGQTLRQLEFAQVRGLEGIREAEVQLAGKTVRLAAAHGLGNAKALLERIKAGPGDYTFVEIMACPGGCIGGGGGPRPTDQARRALRAEALYQLDRQLPLRKSHANPAIQALYRDLGEPGGEAAHKLFHTHYHSRSGSNCQE